MNISSPGDKQLQFPTSSQVMLELNKGTKFGRYPKISTQQTFNMIVSDEAVVDFAGFELAAEIGVGSAREIYNSTFLNRLVVVVNNGVYLVTPQLFSTRVGTLTTSEGPVFIADNLASQIAIVDGYHVYIYNFITEVFTTVTVDFSPVYICYQDTYFIAADGSKNEWRLSEPSNGLLWPFDAQHVGELQTKPTKIVATVPLDRMLLVIGETVTEPWYDVGGQLFPYQRSNSYAIDYGCISSETIATGYGMAVWLAQNERSGVAIMVSRGGGQPQQISNDGLDYLFSQLTQPDQSYGFLFKLEGHVFYQITFTEDNYTFLYDFNTNLFFTLTDENLNYHPAKRVAFFNNDYYFISFKDGNLYRMDSTITTYAGNEIPRIIITNNIRFPLSDRFVLQNLTLTMETGINDEPVPGGAPTTRGLTEIDLSLSRDGGYSFQTIGTKKLQPWGDRRSLINFYNLGGIQNDAVVKFRFKSYGRFVVLGCLMNLYR